MGGWVGIDTCWKLNMGEIMMKLEGTWEVLPGGLDGPTVVDGDD